MLCEPEVGKYASLMHAKATSAVEDIWHARSAYHEWPHSHERGLNSARLLSQHVSGRSTDLRKVAALSGASKFIEITGCEFLLDGAIRKQWNETTRKGLYKSVTNKNEPTYTAYFHTASIAPAS